jgi:holliday junction DNA helicase RuvA
MFGYIKGEVVEVQKETVIVMPPNAIGYEIHFEPKTSNVSKGSEVALFLHFHKSEDSATLFGFETLLEREIFRVLLKISGIGPKTAYKIVSTLSTAELLASLQQGDQFILKKIKGVGPKLAERVAFETTSFLKKHIQELIETTGARESKDIENEVLALSVLEKLGIPHKQAVELVQRAKAVCQPASVDELIKECFKIMKA